MYGDLNKIAFWISLEIYYWDWVYVSLYSYFVYSFKDKFISIYYRWGIDLMAAYTFISATIVGSSILPEVNHKNIHSMYKILSDIFTRYPERSVVVIGNLLLTASQNIGFQISKILCVTWWNWAPWLVLSSKRRNKKAFPEWGSKPQHPMCHNGLIDTT